MSLKLPSSLAFCKSLNPTDAVFSQGVFSDPSEERPLVVEVRKNLGVMASMKVEAGDKDPEKVMDLNPTLSDRAILDPDCDTLIVRFGVDIVGMTHQPHACNDTRFIALVRDFHDAYAEIGGFRELAERYVRNIASGVWLWRNRTLSHAIEVTFSSDEGAFEPVTVDGFAVPAGFEAELPGEIATALDPMITAVETALRGGGLASMQITGRARMGRGRETYPSQVFPVKEASGADDKRGATDVSRILFHKSVRGVKHAAMHMEKVGAALRAIDTWHNGFTDPETGRVLVKPTRPLVVNPYGQCREVNTALRYKEAPSFRKLLMEMETITASMVTDPEDEDLQGKAHFVMANLIRGGVMGQKDA